MVCFAFFKTWNYFNNWFVLSVYQKQNISGIHINTDLDTDAFQTLDLLKTPTFQMKKGGKKPNKHQYKEHYLWEEISSFSHREKKTLKLLKLEFLRPSQLDLKLQCSSYLLHGFIDQWNPGAQDFQALFFARRTSKKLRNPEETERIQTPRRWTDRSISAKNSSAIVCLPTTNLAMVSTRQKVLVKKNVMIQTECCQECLTIAAGGEWMRCHPCEVLS